MEFLLKLGVEFDDCCGNGRLQLNTAELKFSYFRQALADEIKIDWDNARADYPGNTMAS